MNLDHINIAVLAGQVTGTPYTTGQRTAFRLEVREESETGRMTRRRLDISAFGHLAPLAARLEPGTPLVVEGRFTVSEADRRTYCNVIAQRILPGDGSSLNRVMLQGVLTQPPEEQELSRGGRITHLSLECGHRYRKEGVWCHRVTHIPVVYWDRLPEPLAAGESAWVEGVLAPRSFVDGQGVRVYRTEVSARYIRKGGSAPFPCPAVFAQMAGEEETPFAGC